MKTKEEILKPYIEVPFRHTQVIEKDNALKAMGEYASQFQQEWIPVEVRLPEDDNEVDVTIINEGISEVKTDWYSKDENKWIKHRNIIAWKPKPQPYKPNNHEKRNDSGGVFEGIWLRIRTYTDLWC